MKYKIFDIQLKDYLAPYNDKEYWTLEDAADLAYRRWEELADSESEGSVEQDYAYKQMSKMAGAPTETEVEMALEVFDYFLQKVEE